MHQRCMKFNAVINWLGECSTLSQTIIILHCVSFTAMMEFSSPTMTGSLPSPRSWHASAVLPRQRIFIHGGYDGNQTLSDSFVFDLGESTR